MIDKSLWPLPRPISEAITDSGQPSSPCLLSPGLDGEDWVVGRWDGQNWCTADSYTELLEPDHFMPLPPRSVLFDT